MPKSFGPVLAAIAWHAALLVPYLAAFGGDLSALVCVDQERIGHFPFEAISRGFPTGGYDGQYYYVIARRPWKPEVASIDSPGARQLRILYPTLGWLGSGGNGRLLLVVLPLVNLAAIGGLAWLGARLGLRQGLSPWWGFVLPLAVNAGLPILRDLTDPLAALTVFGLLAAWLEAAPGWRLALWAAAALLSREQNLAVVLILLATATWNRRRPAVVGLAAAVGLWLGWVVILRGTYGAWPFLPGQGNFGWPLAGMYYRWTHLGGLSGSRFSALAHGLRMAHLTGMILLAVALLRFRGDAALALFTLAGVLLAVLGGIKIYEDAWSYTRVFTWLPLGIWLTGVQDQRTWPLWLLIPAALWPIFGIVLAWQT